MAKIKSSDVGEYIKIGLYIGGAFLAYKAIKKLSETFGLTKSEADVATEEAIEQAGGSSVNVGNSPFLAFSPSYAATLINDYNKTKAPKVFNYINQFGAKASILGAMPKMLYDSKGFFYDDPERTYNIFRLIQTQYQLAIVASIFSTKYNKDLLTYLKSFLNAEELNIIVNIVKNYPKYY
tara:strand:+ start:739 stop:1278 length:540 start_codon:yes stop_codon:yes gene_type:complete